MNKSVSWKLDEGKWIYTDDIHDRDNKYPFATIEQITTYGDNDFEINFQFVVTMIGTDESDCKNRAERAIDALRTAIPNPKKPWWKFW